MAGAIDKYRGIPSWAAWMLAGLLSGIATMVAAIAAGVAAVYLYDRGMSKGNDLAVFLIGLLAVGTFVFAVTISWLLKMHHDISGRVPVVALLFPLAIAVLATFVFYDSNYAGFVLVGWMLILICGLAANAVAEHYIVNPDAERSEVEGTHG